MNDQINNVLELKAKPVTAGLDERCLLVFLSIGYWNGQKIDKVVSGEVVEEKHADKDAGDWTTRIIPKKDLKDIKNARSQARATHLRYTLPWLDEGQRILPAKVYLEYAAEMRKAKDNYEEKVAEFVARYPGVVAEAKRRLRKLYNEEHFPSAREVKDRFPWILRFNPLPQAQDFRVDLGADVTKEIQDAIHAQASEALTVAMSDVWGRLHDQVSKIAKILDDPKAIFRDSLIENARELCDLLPKLNVAGDGKLDKARADVLKELAKQEPDTLRKDVKARAKVAKAAKGILANIDDYLKPPKKTKAA